MLISLMNENVFSMVRSSVEDHVTNLTKNPFCQIADNTYFVMGSMSG